MGPLFCPGRVLVGTNDRGIDVMGLPVEFARGIGFGLHRGEDAVPNPGFLPAVEPRGHCGGWSITGGQVRPGRAGAQDPENAVDDRAVVVAGTATLAALGRTARREQGLQPRILCVS